MNKELMLLAGEIRAFAIVSVIKSALAKPPKFDDGNPELSEGDWKILLYSLLKSTEALSVILGLSLLEARKVRDSYHRELRRKKQGKVKGARSKMAADRRAFVRENINKTPKWISDMIGVSLETAKTMLAKERARTRIISFTCDQKIAFARIYNKRYNGQGDRIFADRFGVKPETAAGYRRKAGVYLKQDRRRQAP